MSEATPSFSTGQEQLDFAQRALHQGDFMLAHAVICKPVVEATADERKKMSALFRDLEVDRVAIFVASAVAIGLSAIAAVTLFQ